MNYYNPYFYNIPSSFNTPKIGLFSRLFGNHNISFGSILSGTQKTLNVVNQTIPLVKQVHPMIKNAKTMFKVMNEFKKSNIKQKTNIMKNNNITNNNYDEGPTFFI